MEAIDEECMALEAIYGEQFSRLGDTSVRVIIESAETEGCQSPLYIEMTLPDDYPDGCPSFDLGNVNNAALNISIKAQITDSLKDQGSSLLGDNMIYTLMEWAREQLPGWLEASTQEQERSVYEAKANTEAVDKQVDGSASALKGLTKAQKRRHFDRFGAADDKPRGWNWVDILSHLSKGPSQAPQA